MAHVDVIQRAENDIPSEQRCRDKFGPDALWDGKKGQCFHIISKSFDELNNFQQKEILKNEKNDILESIITVGPDFFPEGTRHHKQLKKIFERAKEMDTPWFTHEYIKDNKLLKETIDEFAFARIKKATYIPRSGTYRIIQLTSK